MEVLGRFWEDCFGAVCREKRVLLVFLVENMFYGKIVCKYLRFDIWFFNKIGCFFIFELEFLFVNRGSFNMIYMFVLFIGI